ncbi:hypothetical protein FPL09_06800 [Spiribacter vilamensis]|nr:hypothetical protein FPL09_06800 [Spiribacter vilamensis]
MSRRVTPRERSVALGPVASSSRNPSNAITRLFEQSTQTVGPSSLSCLTNINAI